MRILMTSDAVGGVWTYCLELARALEPHGARIVLAVLGEPPGAAQRAQVEALRHVELHTFPGRLEWMDDPWADVERAGTWLLELARSTEAELVHLNDYSHGALPWGVPALVVGHSCCLSWWHAVRGGEPPRAWSRYRDSVRRGLAGADLVVAPTRSMLAELERLYGPLGPARVIPNGTRLPEEVAGEREPFVLGAGRLWDQGKNAEVLARAAQGLSWPVMLAGDTRGPDGRSRELPHVRCTGLLAPQELARLQSRASIFAHPARYEPFGLAPLEAALRGCALVLGDLPSLREVWGDAALLVDPLDERALARALESLIADPVLLRERARRARARAQRYTAARMASAYWTTYHQLLHWAEPVAPLSLEAS